MGILSDWQNMGWVDRSNLLMSHFKSSNQSIGQRKLISGFGFNNATYMVQPMVDGVRLVCPCYRTWKNMIDRTNSRAVVEIHPTYGGVSVCDEWRNFMSFREWWVDNYVEGFFLDKDLLSGLALYSPSNCIFVPRWLNNFTTDSAANRTKHPIGVSIDRNSGMFNSRCCNPITGQREHLGIYANQEDAHEAWLSRKLGLAIELKPKMDEIDWRIYPRVVEIIKSAK